MKRKEIAANFFVFEGAINTGVLISGERAVLINCCDRISPSFLASLGVRQVDKILCTDHKRSNIAGAAPLVREGAALVAPEGERNLFEDVEAYWDNPENRWHLYHHQPGPEVLAASLPVARGVKEGDEIQWEGYSIQVIDTPGPTHSSVSYIVEVDKRRICFGGDVLLERGQIPNLYALQKNPQGGRDYHSFLGNREKLSESLRKLSALETDVLVPSRGGPVEKVPETAQLLLDRLAEAWRSYISTNALRYFFPGIYNNEKNPPEWMEMGKTFDRPHHVRHVEYTSNMVVSDSGAAFLIDCGSETVVDVLVDKIRQGEIRSVEGCWLTHYHDDHVDGLARLQKEFDCPIHCDQHMAEIVEHPERFYLPCISHVSAPVAHATHHGETWQWREFAFQAFHFPGQTYYHGGLLVEGKGSKVFFSGDSFTPSGCDDYCAQNRNPLGKGRGHRACLDILRQTNPDCMIGSHIGPAFSFSEDQISTIEKTLEEREAILSSLFPWPHPNFGADENWVRVYPFEQEIQRNLPFSMDVQFTNYGSTPASASVEPVLPDGWIWHSENAAETSIAAQTDGSVDPRCACPDGFVRIRITAPESAPCGRHVIPFRVTWDGLYLGQFRHGIAVIPCDL